MKRKTTTEKQLYCNDVNYTFIIIYYERLRNFWLYYLPFTLMNRVDVGNDKKEKEKEN